MGHMEKPGKGAPGIPHPFDLLEIQVGVETARLCFSF
jgi:hypothetical protein